MLGAGRALAAAEWPWHSTSTVSPTFCLSLTPATGRCTEALIPGKWLDNTCIRKVDKRSFAFLCFHTQPLHFLLFFFFFWLNFPLLNSLLFPPSYFLPPHSTEESDRATWWASCMQPRPSPHREVLLPSVQLSKTLSQNYFQITYNSFLKNNSLTLPFITSITMMKCKVDCWNKSLNKKHSIYKALESRIFIEKNHLEKRQLT